MTSADQGADTAGPDAHVGTLAILAGEGGLPVQVARAAAAKGRRVFVAALDGPFDERLRDFELQVVKWGQIGFLQELGKRYGVTEVVLAGTVKRPDFRSVRLDFGAVRLLPRLLKGVAGGDDSALGFVARLIEEMGYRVIGPSDVAPDLVAVRGAVAGPPMPQELADDAAHAMRAAKAVGALDAGQAAVAVAGRIVALEAAEGTDAMAERVGALHAEGRVKWRGRGGILAKCAKPQQDLRLDMPAIGARTVEAVARAGLAGIAIEAGRVMIVDRAEMAAAAERTGTFVVAVDGS